MRRSYFDVVREGLENDKIILLLGARQVGKTTILRQLYSELQADNKAVTFINIENKQYRKLLDEDPENIFQLTPPLQQEGKLFVFIDEIQYLEDPSNFLKLIYDEYRHQLKFIVTGSSSFYIDKKFKDSLAGRKNIIEIPPLTFKEMLLFKNREDLSLLIGTQSIPLLQKKELYRFLFEYLIWGGYPEVVLADKQSDKISILKELADSYAQKDPMEADIKKPEAYLRLMKLVAGNIGQLVNVQSLSNDLGIDNKTLEKYLWVMRKAFHIHFATPFFNNISSEIRKMPRVYFNDLGLRNYLINNFSPIGNRDDKGEVFENVFYMQLRKDAGRDAIHFWRTQKQQEVDFVLNDSFGNHFAFEVKYNVESFKKEKYKFFKENYKNIPLDCVHLGNIIEFDLKNYFH